MKIDATRSASDDRDQHIESVAGEQIAGEKPASRKINLFVFATHHTADNIASQRFKGLLKYLDFQKYRVFIFSRAASRGAGEASLPAGGEVDLNGIHVLNFRGHCVGTESSTASSLLPLISAFASGTPFLAAATNRMLGRDSDTWLINALDAADTLCRARLAAGEACIVIGTYSPIDALVAARCLSAKHHLPCLQDFRDGLTFETLGRQGRLSALLRQLVESRVVTASGLVTTVSRALVNDFERRYPRTKVGLMPNGYDPADFSTQDDESRSAASKLMAQHVPPGKRLIGHFGRISASDHSRIGSLECFVRAMNASPIAGQHAHALFVGELTPIEREIVARLECTHSTVDSVPRPVALNLMMQCQQLLLITGDGVGCATGKLFEYLAAGPQVICFSGVENEASRILAETGAGATVLTTDAAQAPALLDRLFGAASGGAAQRGIGVYSKVEQVRQFDRWLSGMVA